MPAGVTNLKSALRRVDQGTEPDAGDGGWNEMHAMVHQQHAVIAPMKPATKPTGSEWQISPRGFHPTHKEQGVALRRLPSPGGRRALPWHPRQDKSVSPIFGPRCRCQNRGLVLWTVPAGRRKPHELTCTKSRSSG
jgi:hypothetical protein